MRLSLEALRFPATSSLRIVPIATDELRRSAPSVLARAETMDFRTLMPERGGLFDPKLFGPGTVIDAPLPAADEVVGLRKTMFGRIPLALPLVHPLAIEHATASLATLAGKDASDVARAATDADAGRALVAALEGKHDALILRELPVLPPDLRSLRRDEHDRWLATPLNGWYQRIHTRNARIERLLASGAAPDVINPEYAELSVTIRGLCENDELAVPACDGAGDTLPSLRTMCGGTTGLHAALEDLAARGPAQAPGEPLPGRLYLARAVLFALGFMLELD